MTINGLLQIGGAEKHSGKTTLSTLIINKISADYPLYAVKVTILHDKGKSDGYSLIEEKDCESYKDTCRLLKSGAKKVFWLRTDEASVMEGFEDFLSQIDENPLILCESNSLRNFIKPDLFILVKRKYSDNYKDSTKRIIDYADIIVETEILDGNVRYSANIVEKIKIIGNTWTL